MDDFPELAWRHGDYDTVREWAERQPVPVPQAIWEALRDGGARAIDETGERLTVVENWDQERTDVALYGNAYRLLPAKDLGDGGVGEPDGGSDSAQ